MGPVTHLGVKAVSPTSQNSRVRRDPKDPFSSGTAYPESTGQSSTTEGQVTQPHRLSCPGVTCDGTPRAHPPPRPGPGALPAPAPGAFSPSPFPEGESARHHHIPLPESSPQAPAAVACLGPSASCPRRVCTRPPSRGATSTEPQGLSTLCDSESGDPGAGDESHWRGPAERSAWLRGGPGGGGSFKAGPSWSAGGRGGAARGHRHATLARVFAWADSHLRK